jgi:hypothetical protein
MLGRPRDGKEVKKSYSVRLEPKIKEKICKKYGSLQKFIDGILNGDIHPYHNYITVRSKNEDK